MFKRRTRSPAWSRSAKKWEVLQGMASTVQPSRSSRRAPESSRAKTGSVSPERMARVRSGIPVSLQIRVGTCSWSRDASVLSRIRW